MAPMAEPARRPGDVSGARPILVVDDNPVVTGALAKLLERNGFSATTASDAAEAMSVAREASPAAAVIDIHLPGVSGLTLSQRLRERFGESLPIVILSGDTSPETLGALADAGATYFFSKPVNARTLVERLRELVG